METIVIPPGKNKRMKLKNIIKYIVEAVITLLILFLVIYFYSNFFSEISNEGKKSKVIYFSNRKHLRKVQISNIFDKNLKISTNNRLKKKENSIEFNFDIENIKSLNLLLENVIRKDKYNSTMIEFEVELKNLKQIENYCNKYLIHNFKIITTEQLNENNLVVRIKSFFHQQNELKNIRNVYKQYFESTHYK